MQNSLMSIIGSIQINYRSTYKKQNIWWSHMIKSLLMRSLKLEIMKYPWQTQCFFLCIVIDDELTFINHIDQFDLKRSLTFSVSWPIGSTNISVCRRNLQHLFNCFIYACNYFTKLIFFVNWISFTIWHHS